MTRDELIDSQLRTMRLALRAIAGYGDCLNSEGKSQPDCDCPICIADSTLNSENEWRFIGYYRPAPTTRERALKDAWKTYMTSVGGTSDVDGKMRQILGEEPSERDWYVATTIIAWLGTNCGTEVLRLAGFVPEESK